MTAILVSLFAKFWPIIVGVFGIAGGALFGWVKTKSADTKVAQADQQTAQAQTTAAQAQQKVAEVKQSESDANAAAAQAGANAAKERSNVENDVGSLPDGSAAQQLRDQWSKD